MQVIHFVSHWRNWELLACYQNFTPFLINIDFFLPETSHHNAANCWGKAQDSGSCNLQPWITSWFSWTIPHDASFHIWAASKVKLMDFQIGLWKHGEGETIMYAWIKVWLNSILCAGSYVGLLRESALCCGFETWSPPTASHVLNPCWSSSFFLSSPWTHVWCLLLFQVQWPHFI